MNMTWLQMNWLHEISQTALAAAVLTLGVVILLELRSIKLMRHAMDTHLGRVFEQLDLLRFEQHSIEARSSESTVASPALSLTPTSLNPANAPAPLGGSNAYAAAAALASTGMQPEDIAQRCGLAAGEVRLLASLAAARVSRRNDTSSRSTSG
jgi:hypothetical protein